MHLCRGRHKKTVVAMGWLAGRLQGLRLLVGGKKKVPCAHECEDAPYLEILHGIRMMADILDRLIKHDAGFEGESSQSEHPGGQPYAFCHLYLCFDANGVGKSKVAGFT